MILMWPVGPNDRSRLCLLVAVAICHHEATTDTNSTRVPSLSAACSYNGKIDAVSGVCVCLPQWQGPHCASLRLLPADKEGGFHSPHSINATNTSSWGGSILQDEKTGLWHMFSAVMQGDCGIGSWSTNSQVSWSDCLESCD